MSIRSLIRIAWKFFRSNRLIWVFVAIYAVSMIIDMIDYMVYPFGKNSFGFTPSGIISFPICYFAICGFIYIANRLVFRKPAIFQEAWHLFRSRFINLIIFECTCFVIFGVLAFIVAFGVVLSGSHVIGKETAGYLGIMATQISGIFYIIVTGFGERAVMLENKNAFIGITHGIKVFNKVLWPATYTSAMYCITLFLLEFVTMLSYLHLTNSPAFDNPASHSLSSLYLSYNNIPAVRLVSAIARLILYPMLSLVLTQLYLYNSPAELPVLRNESRATSPEI